MSDDFTRVRNHWPLMKIVAVWFFVIVLLVAGLRWAGLIALPAWLTLERKAFTHSHQYVETKKTAIAKMIAECRELPADSLQKTELRQRINTEKALIPADATQFMGECN